MPASVFRASVSHVVHRPRCLPNHHRPRIQRRILFDRVFSAQRPLHHRHEVHHLVFLTHVFVCRVLYHSDDLVVAMLSVARTPKVRAPIGFRPSKSFFTNASLTTDTGTPAEVSCGPIPRPITTLVPTESKYSALAFTNDEVTFRFGWPSTCTLFAQLSFPPSAYRWRARPSRRPAMRGSDPPSCGRAPPPGWLHNRRLAWFNVHDIAILGLNLHVRTLEFAQALREQTCPHQ